MAKIVSQGNRWSLQQEKIENTGNVYTWEKEATTDGDLIICFDDFAISNPGVSEDRFGKYSYKTGTSMSTPYVTAAVGLVSSNENKGLAAKEIILQSVRKTENLTDKVSTGGVLDLSKLPAGAIMPALNLPTDENEAKWNNIDNYAIELQNTIDGREYEYTIDEGTTWIDCNNNQILIDNDGIYNIQVREKGAEKESDSYKYKLDVKAPYIDVEPAHETEKTIKIKVNDYTSGVKNTNIEYIFSKSKTAPENAEEYETADLINGEVTIQLPQDINGTYYLYIKPIEDNASNKSSSVIHKYGSDELTTELIIAIDYKIEESQEANYIYIPHGTELEEVKTKIDTNGTVTVEQNKNSIVNTGMKIKITQGNSEKMYTVVVIGDINGDGEINGTDLFILARYQVKYEDAYQKVVGEYKKAANVYSKDEIINGNDLYKLARVLVQADNI